MKRWIAFLRGVNVGGHNKLPMKELRGILEESGYEDVETYIQSGNVVFESTTRSASSLGKKIAACVPGKDAKQCHERYKAQKEQMKAARGA